MGASGSIAKYEVENKPLDASDVTNFDEAKAEVVRLRGLPAGGVRGSRRRGRP